MTQNKNNGQIVGRASVILGDNIALGALTDTETGEPIGIGIMEMLDATEQQLNFGTQIKLIFPNLSYVNSLRTALDSLETQMKEWTRNVWLNKNEEKDGSTDK